MVLITDKDVADIKAALEDIAPYVEEPITYRRRTGIMPGDPAHGEPDTPQYDNQARAAVVRKLTLEEITISGGAYELGDLEFTIRMDQEPAYEDRIVYNGRTFRPKSIGKLYLKEVLWWDVRAGKE